LFIKTARNYAKDNTLFTEVFFRIRKKSSGSKKRLEKSFSQGKILAIEKKN